MQRMILPRTATNVFQLDFDLLEFMMCHIHAQNWEEQNVAKVSGGRTEIRSGGLAWEAAKQPIIRAKRPHAKVKNWGALAPLI